jgi:CRISPR/Cas system-associated endoribonuclease Cas2
MAYLLILDLDGASGERRKVNRFLRRNAQVVQNSVWRFRSYGELLAAAERVTKAGGRVLAFLESDRIIIGPNEVREFLNGLH